MHDKKYVKGEGERGGMKGLVKERRMGILYLFCYPFLERHKSGKDQEGDNNGSLHDTDQSK